MGEWTQDGSLAPSMIETPRRAKPPYRSASGPAEGGRRKLSSGQCRRCSLVSSGAGTEGERAMLSGSMLLGFPQRLLALLGEELVLGIAPQCRSVRTGEPRLRDKARTAPTFRRLREPLSCDGPITPTSLDHTMLAPNLKDACSPTSCGVPTPSATLGIQRGRETNYMHCWTGGCRASVAYATRYAISARGLVAPDKCG